MSRRTLLLLATLVAPLTVQAQSNACPAGPATAEPFGPPATRADSGRMFSYTLTPDGREFWFFKKVGTMNSEDYRIFRSVRQGNGWSAPEQVRLGADASDLYPSFSADGSRLVFSSYRPVPGDTSRHPNAHLYLSHRTATGWSEPELIRASRIGHYHSGAKQLADGTITVGVTTPDWRSRSEQQIRWDGSRFAEAMELRAADPAGEYWRTHVGDSLYVWGAFTSSRGVTLVSVSRVLANGRRAPATYFLTSARSDGSFTPLTPARGGLDTEAPNFAWFSADGCWLYFTRDYSEFKRVPVAGIR